MRYSRAINAVDSLSQGDQPDGGAEVMSIARGQLDRRQSHDDNIGADCTDIASSRTMDDNAERIRTDLPVATDERRTGRRHDELQRQRDEYYDLLLRKTAEFDNYRKRTERERQAARRVGGGRV